MTPRAQAGLALEVRDLVVAFADGDGTRRTVLDLAHCTLAPRAQIALCGPSGSGKTALLHALAGIARPQSGVVRWGSVEVTALAPTVADRWRRETLGFVFQQFHLFAGLSALENVLLPARFDRWRVPAAVAARARALVERVGVLPRARVEKLSRGEQQRVAAARALLREPAIVLADEPTASLDRDAATVVEDLLRTLCDEAGATLVVATHDARLAARLDARYDIVERSLRRCERPSAVARVA